MHATARVVWAAMIEGRSAATVAALTCDLGLFGRLTWGVRDRFAVIRRAIELARDGSAALRDAAVAFAEHERERGTAPASIDRRWRSLAALARALSHLWPSSPPIDLGAPPDERAPRLEYAARQRLVADLLARDAVRDAALLGLVATTSLGAAAIARLRVGEARQLGAGEPVRCAIAAWTRGRDARALAFPGRTRGRPMGRTTVDRVCERHGTSVAALRCDQRARGAA